MVDNKLERLIKLYRDGNITKEELYAFVMDVIKADTTSDVSSPKDIIDPWINPIYPYDPHDWNRLPYITWCTDTTIDTKNLSGGGKLEGTIGDN